MSDNFAYAGIDIGGTNIKYGLIDRSGKILFKEHRPSLVSKGAEPLMHLVTNIAESLMFHAAEDDLHIEHLGVGTPGAVDTKTGTVIGPSPNIKGWQGMEIGRILSERLNMPVTIDNDVNATALAELKYGSGAGFDSMICVAIGTGVGGGIILNGKLWRGANHTAGEIGHICIDPNGPLCACGAHGCIEVYCKSAAIIERTRKHLNGNMTDNFKKILEGDIDNLSIRKIFTALKKGDLIAKDVIEETADFLAIGLSGVVNLLNPQIVVIGGGVADGGGGFVEAVAAKLKKRAFSSATENLRVAKAALGNDAGFVGAGILGETLL